MIEYDYPAIEKTLITDDMRFNRLPIETIVSCVYNYEETIILFGEYIDKFKELSIKKLWKLNNKSVREIGDILINLNCRSVRDSQSVWLAYRIEYEIYPVFEYLKNYFDYNDKYQETKDNLFSILKRNGQIKNNEIIENTENQVLALQQLLWLCELEIQGFTLTNFNYINTFTHISYRVFYHRLGYVWIPEVNNKYSRIITVPHRNFIKDLDNVISRY